MKTKRITVLPYDPQWKENFKAIRLELAESLGDLALRIEHVGSTSVEGLQAKPIIDIDVVIRDNTPLDTVIAALAKIGYQHEGNLGIPQREAFRYDGKPHLQKHHLYVCPESSPELRRHTAFRDYLRTHPEDAAEYGRIKMEAARLYPEDIEKYLQHKGFIIDKIYSISSASLRSAQSIQCVACI